MTQVRIMKSSPRIALAGSESSLNSRGSPSSEVVKWETHSLTAARNRLWVVAPSMLTGHQQEPMRRQQWVRCPARSHSSMWSVVYQRGDSNRGVVCLRTGNPRQASEPCGTTRHTVGQTTNVAEDGVTTSGYGAEYERGVQKICDFGPDTVLPCKM